MGRLKTIKGRVATLPRRLAATPQPNVDRSKARSEAQPWRAWYKTARWQKLRLKVIRRAGWKCQATGVDLGGKYPAPNSPVADHIRPHRGSEKLFWDEDNLQAVSKEYHDREKQRIEHQSQY